MLSFFGVWGGVIFYKQWQNPAMIIDKKLFSIPIQSILRIHHFIWNAMTYLVYYLS